MPKIPHHFYSYIPLMYHATSIESLTQLLPKLSPPLVLVPTMGALHEGHATLVRKARELAGENGSVILSLFVNPTQFNQSSDLDNYPRTLDADLNLCKELGVDTVFSPEPDQVYRQDHSISVLENSLSKQLCGATRPGHFDGVCTIVLKLFNLTGADIAVFGKKDYQQLAIIHRLVRDLHLPINIVGVETVRESSGLALSSRNTNLTSSQRDDAARIRKALLSAKNAVATGEKSANQLINIAKLAIETSPEGAKIDYLQLVDAETLAPIEAINPPALLATAVFYGDVRLIDNIELF